MDFFTFSPQVMSESIRGEFFGKVCLAIRARGPEATSSTVGVRRTFATRWAASTTLSVGSFLSELPLFQATSVASHFSGGLPSVRPPVTSGCGVLVEQFLA